MSNESNNGKHHEGDVAFIKSLAELLNASELNDISVKREYGEHDRLTVSLSKQGKQVTVTQPAYAPAAPASAPAPAAAPAAAAPAPAASAMKIPPACPARSPRPWSARSICRPSPVPQPLFRSVRRYLKVKPC